MIVLIVWLDCCLDCPLHVSCNKLVVYILILWGLIYLSYQFPFFFPLYIVSELDLIISFSKLFQTSAISSYLSNLISWHYIYIYISVHMFLCDTGHDCLHLSYRQFLSPQPSFISSTLTIWLMTWSKLSVVYWNTFMNNLCQITSLTKLKLS